MTLKKQVYLWAVLKEQHLVVLFWYFRKKCHGFVNQWKASLKWVAFFLLFSFAVRYASGSSLIGAKWQRCKAALLAQWQSLKVAKSQSAALSGVEESQRCRGAEAQSFGGFLER